jgi:hypothetical protein
LNRRRINPSCLPGSSKRLRSSGRLRRGLRDQGRDLHSHCFSWLSGNPENRYHSSRFGSHLGECRLKQKEDLFSLP